MNRAKRYATGLIVASAAVSGVVVPTVVAPVAGAAEGGSCSVVAESGSASWGVRGSYLSYLHTPATLGEVLVSGGAKAVDAKKGPFEFALNPAASKIQSESKGVFAFDGELVIHGHPKGDAWELDQKLSDVKVAVDGSKGYLIADFTSARYPNPDGLAPYSADDAVIADIVWPSAPKLVAGEVSLAGADVKLTQKAADELFAKFYSAGAEMAPIVVSAKLGQKCEAPTETPVVPSETVKPTEDPKPSETVKPTEDPKPSETVKPAGSFSFSKLFSGTGLLAFLGIGAVIAVIAGIVHHVQMLAGHR